MNCLTTKPTTCLSLVFLVCVGMGGCAPEAPPELGEWTLEKGVLTLTEDLVVSETDAFYLGAIAGRSISTPGPGLDVLSDGRMVVADTEAQNVKLLRRDGTLIDTLGRSGEGPGEFQRLGAVQAARGDSIYAYDGRQLTVFAPAPSHDAVRTIRLEADRIPPYRVLVTDTRLGALYGTPFLAGRGLEDFTWFPWRQVSNAGVPGDTLFTVRMRRMASVQTGERNFSLHPLPFERTMPVTTGPENRFYVGHTDSLHVEAYPQSAGSEVVASIPTKPVPVTERARDSALGKVTGEMQSKVASAVPDTKPAITDLVVADNGQLWVQRPAEEPDVDTVAWWVLDPATKTLRKTRLPESVDLEVVQDGHAYGSTTTEMGAPAVVRYQIES